MLVTHYGIRKLLSNTQWISFSLETFLGRTILFLRDLFPNPKAPVEPSALFNQSPAWQSRLSGPSLYGTDEMEGREKTLD